MERVELNRLYHTWNKEWKKNQSLRHENWEARRLNKNSFEENLYKRVQWEKDLKKREWKKYRMKIKKRIEYVLKKDIVCVEKR